MNSAQTLFFFAGFTSLGAFLHLSFNFWNILHMIQAERLLCSCILRNAFASRIGSSEECECWLLFEFSALKYSSPNFHHTSYCTIWKVWDRNACGQLERSVVSFVLLYNCGFFLCCSLSFTLRMLWLWSTCSLWLSHRNAFVSLEAVRFL